MHGSEAGGGVVRRLGGHGSESGGGRLEGGSLGSWEGVIVMPLHAAWQCETFQVSFDRKN